MTDDNTTTSLRRALALTEADMTRLMAENVGLTEALAQARRALEAERAARQARDALLRAIAEVTTDPAVRETIRKAYEEGER